MTARTVGALALLAACSRTKTPAGSGATRHAQAVTATTAGPSATPPSSGAGHRTASVDAAPSATGVSSSTASPSAVFELGSAETPTVKPPELPPRPAFRSLERSRGTPVLRGFVEVKRDAEEIWDTRYVWLEQSGTALEGLMADELGMPTKLTGAVTADGAFELRYGTRGDVVLAGHVADARVTSAKLRARLAYGAPSTKARPLVDARIAPFSPAATEALVRQVSTYQGFAGDRAVLLRVARASNGELRGELRLPRGESRELRGSVAASGELVLHEQRGAETLGTLTLVAAAADEREATWAPLVGVYEPADTGRAGFVALDPDGRLQTATLPLTGGRRVEARFASYAGGSCRFFHEWPVVTGANVSELNRKLAALSMRALEVMPCDEPYGPTTPRAYLTERTYRAAPVGKALFGVSFEQTDDGGGAHELVSSSCYLVDAEAGRVLNLTRALADAPHAAALVTQRLLAERHVQSLSELRNETSDAGSVGAASETVPIGDANLCPVEGGLEVRFDPYVIGPWAIGSPSVTLTRVEAKGLFSSDPSIDAWLR